MSSMLFSLASLPVVPTLLEFVYTHGMIKKDTEKDFIIRFLELRTNGFRILLIYLLAKRLPNL